MSCFISRAPVRISFGGGGTDLAAYYVPFGGLVVSAAITRYCFVVAADSPDRSIRINSGDYRVWQTFPRRPQSQRQLPPVEEPLSLPKAVIEWAGQSPDAERDLSEIGVDLFLTSEVPPGTGLGSSSAMAVALVYALAAHVGIPVDASRAAETASRLEIERLDMPIGKQDQYASAFGGLNAITFAADRVEVEPLALPPDVKSTLGSRLLLFSTGQSRHSAQILRQQQRDTAVKSCVTESLHRLKALAENMRQALADQDLDRFGELLDGGWQHKKQLSGMVSTESIDRWYEAARCAGALGGKITGAGGGGFLLLYCPQHRQEAVREAMTGFGLQELSFDFDFTGAEVVGSRLSVLGSRPTVARR